MRISYTIQGTINVPDGSLFSKEQANLLILPDGKAMSVQPIVELNTSIEDDNHRNITYDEGAELGIFIEDYDRTITEFNETIPSEQTGSADPDGVLTFPWANGFNPVR